MAKVSIIIPIYNVEKYMRKTIDSVINQIETDIEIILVDDGSTDSSGKICDEYSTRDNRIKVIHKENGGLSSARNAGTKEATSRYVMYLDGDDYLKENAVEKVLSVMKEYPSDIIQYQYQEVESEKSSEKQKTFKEIFQATTSRELFKNLYFLGGAAASGATKLLRRDLMIEIPYISIRHEDEMWCTQAFQRNLIVTYIPDELYCYVMREGSIIHSKFNRGKLDSFTVSEERIQVLQRCGYTDLLSYEYRRFFKIVLALYQEASLAGDMEAQRVIKEKFEKYKNEINASKALSGKFYVIFKCMCINYSWINLYSLYKRSKNANKQKRIR